MPCQWWVIQPSRAAPSEGPLDEFLSAESAGGDVVVNLCVHHGLYPVPGGREHQTKENVFTADAEGTRAQFDSEPADSLEGVGAYGHVEAGKERLLGVESVGRVDVVGVEPWVDVGVGDDVDTADGRVSATREDGGDYALEPSRVRHDVVV